jgi:hypothetical protein
VKTLLVSTFVLALPALAAGAQLALRPLGAEAFRRLTDTGPRGTVTFEAGGAYERLARPSPDEEPLSVRGMPLPGGKTIDLELRPVSALEPGARARAVQADGSVRSVAPSVRCYSGFVAGGGSAFLGVTASEAHGYFTIGADTYFLSPGEEPVAGRAVLAHAASLGAIDWTCGAPERWVAEPGGPSVERLTAPVLRVADVFFEADFGLRARYASDQACADYVVLLVTAASEIYRRDLGARLNIPDGYLRIWNQVAPWGVINGFASLKNVYTYWLSASNPLRSLPRAAVHVMTSPVFGGTARGTGGLCDNVRAYEISSLGGRFPYPTQHKGRDNWDLFVLCHELGHTFGSVHSHEYLPPIECADGSGPDSGTLMSYCHNVYGIAQLGMRFHPREQQRIRDMMLRWKCMRSTALMQGDYDGDGRLTRTDLTAARSVLFQGFRSLGAQEVLDLDADLDADWADYLVLGQLVYGAPPASVAPRNGRGLNPPCLEAAANPVLGTTWTLRMAASEGSSTLVVGFEEPLDGYTTARGELLVRTQLFGGTKLFSVPAAVIGGFARHDVDLPLDPALFGRPVTFQGLVTGGDGSEHYCNALDAILSPYE